MIFKDKTEFTSDPFTVEDNKIFVTVANKGVVYLEVLEQDEEWRSFPQTTLLGPVSKYVAVPSEMSLRVKIPTLNTVSAYKAVAVEVDEEELPVEELPVEPTDPEIPEDPQEPEEPVDPPTEEPPVEEEPEIPEEPPVNPIQYETITTTPNDYDSEWWSNGVWINTERSGINIPNTDTNVKAFVPGAVVKFSDASEKTITQVQVIGANISVWFEGAKLSPTLGYPSTVSVQVVKEPVVVIPESNSKAAGPNFGMNFASGTFSDHDVTKLPGIYNTHYTYPNKDTFSRWKARGVKHVRLPIRWERIQRTLNAPLDSVEAARNTLAFAAANDVRVFGWMAGDWLDATNVLSIEVGGVAQAQLSVYQEFNKNMVQHGPNA